MNPRQLTTILVIAVAALLSAGMSLSAMTSGTRTTDPGAGVTAPAAHHGAREAAVVFRYRFVRRCALVPVKRAGKVVRRNGKVVKRRVCKRVRVRVRVVVPPTTTTTAATTPTVATAPTVPTSPTTPGTTTGTTTSGTTTSGTTTGGATTSPVQGTLTVREFSGPDGFVLTLSASSVPAGTYTVRRRVEGGINHNLDIRPTGGAQVAFFGLTANTEDSQTIVLTPGQWTFRCTVPGHAAMLASLTVT